MPNKTYALEWMDVAYKNMETARLLIRENHFTDSIAIELHQTIEKSFKAIYAYLGITIPRTHSLMLLFNFVEENIQFPHATKWKNILKSQKLFFTTLIFISSIK
jgi:HEPN domain-containing protein